jgi:hypothetical protein
MFVRRARLEVTQDLREQASAVRSAYQAQLLPFLGNAAIGAVR